MNRKHEVTLFDINFVSDAKMGDEAIIHTKRLECFNAISPLESAFRHCIKRKAENHDICLAETRWRTSNL